ncbi:MAG: peptidase S41 [Proteobacteria bacterium]|nr:MAG: peptidase S41 [Pseudomonadota bacterium]
MFYLGKSIDTDAVKPVCTHLQALGLALCMSAPAIATEADTPEQQHGIPEATLHLPAPETRLPLEELRRFTEVFDRIKKTYVEEVDDSTLLNNAVKGMLSGLDPHSTYLEPTAFDDLQESTSGEFGGLGIEVGMEDGFIKVISPIDDTPASKAGVEAGDIIIKLDGTPVKGMSLEEAVNTMRGKPGTPITLTIVREGENTPITKKVIRDVIKVTSVKTRLLKDNIGYIRITQFQAKTGEDFLNGLKKINQKAGAPIQGLIIDLRNNPGGVLQAAVDVADSLLEDGLIVYTEGRIQSSQLRFSATPGDETGNIPIIVLINGGSASASEILAGALQDHSRAIILGTDSFGKGSVQTVIPLNEEYGLKLTTARYYTPSGRSIQALGITPDVVVKRAKLTELQSGPSFKEADLARHLSNGTTEENAGDGEPSAGDGEPSANDGEPSANDGKPSANNGKTSKENKAKKQNRMIDRDFQLREAINLMKGLIIFANNSENPTE